MGGRVHTRLCEAYDGATAADIREFLYFRHYHFVPYFIGTLSYRQPVATSPLFAPTMLFYIAVLRQKLIDPCPNEKTHITLPGELSSENVLQIPTYILYAIYMVWGLLFILGLSHHRGDLLRLARADFRENIQQHQI